MWYCYFHTPQLPVSALLSPLTHSTLFSLWHRLFQSQNTFPTIPCSSALFWLSENYLPLKWALVWKIWKNPHLEAQLYSEINLHLLIHQRQKKRCCPFWGEYYSLLAVLQMKKELHEKTCNIPFLKLLFCLHSLHESWRKISFGKPEENRFCLKYWVFFIIWQTFNVFLMDHKVNGLIF